ncbi:hypothetical protein FS837_011665 [Tulasnella sp. UAMH 9824]|nr:hypothetical protein FS837_011665 [Tulasnella sp. UAMH 9824]
MDAQLPQNDLETQVESLSRLLQHLNSVRAQDTPYPPTNTSISYQLRSSHEAAKAFVAALGSDSMQAALNRAQELEAADPTFVPLDRDDQDRYNPKRRKIDKTSLQARTNGNGHVTPLLLRPALDDAPRISTSTLPDYLRTLRSIKQNLRVHIWLPERPSTTSEPPKITSPIILQVCIPNLFIVYVTLVEESPSPSSPDEVLRPQKMVVFGPREKRLPHMQSEFSIFRHMSQTLMKVISEKPATAPSSEVGSTGASLPQLIDLIATYDKLFTDQCCVCQKNMSREGHLPPLERLWMPQPKPTAEAGEQQPLSATERPRLGVEGRWVARHAGCQ